MIYFKHILIATDRLVNTVFFGRVGETISGRAYREKWKLQAVIDAMFFWEPEHCQRSYYWDRDNQDFVS